MDTTNPTQYRLYCVTNMYLSSIQNGIQSAHAAVDLCMKYGEGSYAELVREWATKHKTMIVLNGGYSSNIKLLIESFQQAGLPWADFHEEKDALNGALTAACVVLPDFVYNTMSYIRNERITQDEFTALLRWKPLIGEYDSTLFTTQIVDLMFRLNQLGLAN